jgi:hypothetical protein
MASWVQIANLALSRLGARQIADLAEASAEARAITGVLTTVCDAVLRAHPWNCALARAALAADAEGPAFEYAYAYTLPTDPYCLRVLGIWNSSEPWMVEGRKLLTNQSAPLPLRYLRRVTDPEQLDGAFIAAFAERLAHAVCPVLAPSLEREAALWQSAERLIREARSLDGQEQNPPPRVSGFISARY